MHRSERQEIARREGEREKERERQTDRQRENVMTKKNVRSGEMEQTRKQEA